MPTLKIIPRNLEKLGIILMVLLLVFRPGFVKNFSNNLIGKMLLLGAIVSVAAHNKMYGLLAAFTYVVCVEMSSEGFKEGNDDAVEKEEEEKEEKEEKEKEKEKEEVAPSKKLADMIYTVKKMITPRTKNPQSK